MKIWSESQLVNVVVVIVGLFVIGETVNALTRPTTRRTQGAQKSTAESSGRDGVLPKLVGPSHDGGV